MEITLLTTDDLTENLQTQVAELYCQLNDTNEQIDLSQILSHENKVYMAMCSVNDRVAGIALLATYKVISGHRGIIEDVVVDHEERGKGIGRKLMNHLLQEAKNRNLTEVLLFTGHHRLPAIQLYKSLGFSLRKSGVYNLKL